MKNKDMYAKKSCKDCRHYYRQRTEDMVHSTNANCVRVKVEDKCSYDNDRSVLKSLKPCTYFTELRWYHNFPLVEVTVIVAICIAVVIVTIQRFTG